MILPAETAPRLLMAAFILLTVVMLLGMVFMRFGNAVIARVCARTRYSLLLAVLVIFLPFAGTFGAPSMLYALFVLDGPGQFASLTCISFLLATCVYSTIRLTIENGDSRFGPSGLGDVSDDRWAVVRRLMIYPLGLIVPAVAAVATYRDQPTPSPWVATWILCGVTAGFLAAWAAWYLFSLIEHSLIPPNLIERGLFPTSGLHRFGLKRRMDTDGFWRWIARRYGPSAVGYTHMVEGRLELRPGHAQLISFWVLLTTVYLVRYLNIGLLRLPLHEATAFSVLFHVLTIVLLVGVTLAGASFFLDYYRLPVLWVTLALILTGNVLLDGDHFYELHEAEHPRAVVDYDQVFDDWKFPVGKQGRTFVVVTCSGGGIQASAWAAKVLTELSQRYKGFHDSIAVVSGVSGGSVATMYYTLYGSTRDNSGGKATRVLSSDRARAILQDASRSNLEAAAWGFAYPDFLRVVCPALVPQEVDRGWAMEQLWDSRLKRRGVQFEGREPTLRLLGERVRKGQSLLPIFNATIVETGQRLLISPAAGGLASTGDMQELPWDFFTLFPNSDPHLTTAVRLSATFSYVSPICRAGSRDASSNNHRFHIADGGYTDNEGLVSALQAAKRAVDLYAFNPKFDRVLFIRIVPFPPNPLEASKPRNGWLFSTFGPLLALNAVRVASQAERGNMEVENEIERYKVLKEAVDAVREKNAGTDLRSPMEFRFITFRFDPKRERYDPPLSWKLTQSDRAAIDEAWEKMDWGSYDQGSDTAPSDLDKLFERADGVENGSQPSADPMPAPDFQTPPPTAIKTPAIARKPARAIPR